MLPDLKVKKDQKVIKVPLVKMVSMVKTVEMVLRVRGVREGKREPRDRRGTLVNKVYPDQLVLTDQREQKEKKVSVDRRVRLESVELKVNLVLSEQDSRSSMTKRNKN